MKTKKQISGVTTCCHGLVGLSLSLFAGVAIAGTLQLASGNHAGVPGDDISRNAAVNATGRMVAFESLAGDLIDGDNNNSSDVFVKDLKSGNVAIASITQSGKLGDASSYAPSLSATGRYVAFYSNAGNFVAQDDNLQADVFFKDMKTGRLSLVSCAEDGTLGNKASYNPKLSADGGSVVFFSYATNLVAGGSNGYPQVFVKRIASGQVVQVSSTADDTQANGESYYPTISANGNFVVFESAATNLTAGDSNGSYDIFRKNLTTGLVERVSVSGSGKQANGDSFGAAVSANGRYIAFHSHATNLVGGDDNAAADVFVKDMASGKVVRISLANGGLEADGDSSAATISNDGRFVSFMSDADNLIEQDLNGKSDVFLKDRKTGQLTRVSANAQAWESDGVSRLPAISGNGRFLVFESAGENLTFGDDNSRADVFRFSYK